MAPTIYRGSTSRTSAPKRDLVRYPVEHWVQDPMVWLDMVHPDD